MKNICTEVTPYITMTTSSNQPTTTEIDSIEVIGSTVLFIVNSEATAMKLFKRNPRARVTKGRPDDERYGLVYNLVDCNLISGVKRG